MYLNTSQLTASSQTDRSQMPAALADWANDVTAPHVLGRVKGSWRPSMCITQPLYVQHVSLYTLLAEPWYTRIHVPI